jgi:YesN/AraC family two-component response regulator
LSKIRSYTATPQQGKVLVSDVVMPEMNGVDAAIEIKETASPAANLPA